MAPLLTSANCWAVLLNFIIYHISHITYLKAPWNLSNQKSRYSFLEIFSEIILATLSINEREIVKKTLKGITTKPTSYQSIKEQHIPAGI